jgi:hypothetical protein
LVLTIVRVGRIKMATSNILIAAFLIALALAFVSMIFAFLMFLVVGLKGDVSKIPSNYRFNRFNSLFYENSLSESGKKSRRLMLAALRIMMGSILIAVVIYLISMFFGKLL